MVLNKILKDRRLWLVTIVVFVLLLTFFDRHNFIDRAQLKEDINELEKQRDYYLNRIEEDSTIIENLKDDDFLEQYARENYLMKRKDDVVFIVPE